MDLSSGLGSPLGHTLTPSSVISAGRAAETHGERMAHGRTFRCPRGASEFRIEPKECAERWRAKTPPCLSETYGLCNIGAINDKKYPEDFMGGTFGFCKNPECPNKGRKMSLPAKGLCGTCYKRMRAGKLAWPPKPGQEEMPATSADAGKMGTVSGRAQPFEKIEEFRARQVEPETAGASPKAERCRSCDEVQDHLSHPGKMVDLPEDLDRPFEVAGVRFIPSPGLPTDPPILTIRKDGLAINRAAEKIFGLVRYSHARPVLSEDGKTVGIKFYASDRPGSRLLQRPAKMCTTISNVPFVRATGLIGRKARLESTEWDGFFVARFEGEAA